MTLGRSRPSSGGGRSGRGLAVPPLVVEHVAKSYDFDGQIVPVIGDLSLTLEKGQIVSIVGPSGCGKTTLLNTLCGLLAPDSGHIRWYGREIAGQPQNVGYMLQKDLLAAVANRARQRHAGLEIRGVAPREADGQRAAPCSTSLGFMASPITILRRFLAACASAWRWRGPW